MKRIYQSHSRQFFIVILLLAGHLGPPLNGQEKSDSQQYDKYLQEGQDALVAGEYLLAIRAFERANRLAEHDQPVIAYQQLFQLSLGQTLGPVRRLADAYGKAGMPEEALATWRTFIDRTEKKGQLVFAYNELGCWLLIGGGNEPVTLLHAEASFRKALDLSGGRAKKARLNLAEVLWRQAEPDESFDLLDLLTDQKSEQPWHNLRTIRISEEIIEYAQWTSSRERQAHHSRPRGPLHVGGDVRAPVKIHAPQPQYTPIARKARIQGVVIAQAVIDEEGNVASLEVLKGLPMGLSETAVEAMERWKFEPATLNGEPVAVYYNLTVNFRLQ